MKQIIEMLVKAKLINEAIIFSGIVKRVGMDGNIVLNLLILKANELKSNEFEYPQKLLEKEAYYISSYKVRKGLKKLKKENFITVNNKKYSINIEAVKVAIYEDVEDK